MPFFAYLAKCLWKRKFFHKKLEKNETFHVQYIFLTSFTGFKAIKQMGGVMGTSSNTRIQQSAAALEYIFGAKETASVPNCDFVLIGWFYSYDIVSTVVLKHI